jgi:hypothetical protein
MSIDLSLMCISGANHGYGLGYGQADFRGNNADLGRSPPATGHASKMTAFNARR